MTAAAGDGESFDPLDPAFIASPFATLTRLRGARPVLWHEVLRAWIVLRYADARSVLSEHATFAADPRRAGLPLPPQQVSIQSMDPPDQLPVRNALALAMRQVDLEDVGRRAATRADELLRGADPAGINAVEDLVSPVVVLASTELLGLPAELAPEFAQANRAIVRAMMSGLDPSAAEPGQLARATINRLIAEWIPQARTGLLGALREAPTSDQLDQEHLASSLRVLLLSSINSTSTMTSLALMNLLQRGATRAFVETPDPTVAVHELVRFDGPAQAAGRVCVRETRLGGQTIQRGDQVIVMLASANRDPERFEAPDELRLHRQPNPHLGFGRGAHHCIGTQIALVAGSAVLGAACRSGWRLDQTRPPQFHLNPALRSLSGLALLPPA